MTEADRGTPTDPAPAAVEGASRLRYAAVTDVGRHRKENQDSGYAGEHLLVVADGVGGAAYGDVASATAVNLLRRLDEPPEGTMLSALAGAVHRIHDRLAELVEQDPELEGTSTTVTAALFDGHQLGFAHSGDSRAYLLHDGELRQLTKDHTFVQTLVDEGRITDAEARVHPHRNIILRAVDGVHDTEPDLFEVAVHPGDRVMLCSDGCSGAVAEDQIAELLGSGSVGGAAQGLVRAALDGGTTDNVTVVVAEVVAPQLDPDVTGELAAAPVVVGAAAAQPRRGGMLGRALFRGRFDGGRADTGELERVQEEPVDPEELRYAPRAPRRARRWRRVLAVVLVLGLVAGVLAAGYSWSQRQYYVADDGPDVGIFRGVQVDLPWLDLSTIYQVSDVRIADLPSVTQDQVRAGIVADNLSDARRIVEDLADQARTCPRQGVGAGRQRQRSTKSTQRPSRAAQPSASPSRAVGGTTKASDRPSDRPSAQPSPTPSPTGNGAANGCAGASTP